ncbi:MAG: hypothetical protein SGPRY_013907 [Prymnesium sp.]
MSLFVAQVGPPKMQFCQIWTLREYLHKEFSAVDFSSVSGGFDLERVVDDFVFMCFFVGNDFLPHIPALEIRDGGEPLMLARQSVIPLHDRASLSYLWDFSELSSQESKPVMLVGPYSQPPLLVGLCEGSLHSREREEAAHSPLFSAAIDMLIFAYKQLMPQMGGYLSDAGRVHLARTELLLRENDIFERKRRREEARERNQER